VTTKTEHPVGIAGFNMKSFSLSNTSKRGDVER
jgi:hypothetical protein